MTDVGWPCGKSLDELQRGMGYQFSDIDLLKLALTHPSVFAQTNAPKPPNPPDNQRMEFLGDAVVQLCVSDALFRRYPDMREGDMTHLRITFVRKESLSQAAINLRLDQYILMGTAERGHGTSSQINVMCDAFEAVTAAVYLDGGFGAACAFVARALNDYRVYAESESAVNWKSRLQELMQGTGRRAPRYTIVSVSGPPHAPHFVVDVRAHDGMALGRGQGSSRKAAEQEAARAASHLFTIAGEEPPQPTGYSSLGKDAGELAAQEGVIATQEA